MGNDLYFSTRGFRDNRKPSAWTRRKGLESSTPPPSPMTATAIAEYREVDAPRLPVPFEEPTWHVCRVKPCLELRLGFDLCRLQLSHYIPVAKTTKALGRKRVDTLTPIFPGYVFLYGDKHDCGKAMGTRKLFTILHDPNQERLAHSIEMMQVAWSAGPPALGDAAMLTEGRRCRVRPPHPLAGSEGRIDCVNGRTGCVVVSLPMLGAGTPVEIDVACLEPAD